MKNHVKMLVLFVLVVVVAIQIIQQSSWIQMVSVAEPLLKVNQLQMKAIRAGLPDPGMRALEAIELVATRTGISSEFLLALAYTESGFDLRAVSNKGYNGLFQIPQKVYHPTANALIGIEEIFQEKLRLSNGNYKDAIILYKGFRDNPKRGIIFAEKVIRLARKLKEA